MRQTFIVLLIALVASSCGGAKEVMVNSNYDNTKSTYKAFILPLLGNDVTRENKVLFSTLDQTHIKVIGFESTLQLLQVNERFTEALNKARSSVLNSEASNYPNLYDSLDQFQVKTIQNNTEHADLFFFMHDIMGKTATKVNNSGSISAIGKLSVYDLHTGEFVVQCQYEATEKHDVMTKNLPMPLEDLVVGLMECVRNELE